MVKSSPGTIIDDSVYRNPDWRTAAHHVMSSTLPLQRTPVGSLASLMSGMLQTTATDHCCFCTPQKAAGKDDFRLIPNGTAGIEDRMSAIWHHGVATGRLTPNEFVAVTSTNSAKIFNIHPRKGTIAEGSDADIVVWDPQASRTVSAQTHHQNIDYNIFEGMEFTGVAKTTISNGKVVWNDGELPSVRGAGRYIPRPCHSVNHEAVAQARKVNTPTPVKRG